MQAKEDMKTIFDIKDSEKGNSVLILGAGGTLEDYGDKVKKFIEDNNLKTIGINNSVQFHVPDYHLWTNTGRLKEFGANIDSSSIVLFGSNIKKDVIQGVWPKKYFSVPYTDKQRVILKVTSKHIYGTFRTAGCLSIIIANILGFDNIYIAGMDGYTYHNWASLKDGETSQHFYGKGLTDKNTKEICEEKDMRVYDALRSISSYGIKFSIITPTIFREFYDISKLSDY